MKQKLIASTILLAMVLFAACITPQQQAQDVTAGGVMGEVPPAIGDEAATVEAPTIEAPQQPAQPEYSTETPEDIESATELEQTLEAGSGFEEVDVF
ncbi:MAG: hypothetical protein J4432_02790 [DPANN group archaeon]|nr:hypothetical protein [DPANN group archaeon]